MAFVSYRQPPELGGVALALPGPTDTARAPPPLCGVVITSPVAWLGSLPLLLVRAPPSGWLDGPFPRPAPRCPDAARADVDCVYAC